MERSKLSQSKASPAASKSNAAMTLRYCTRCLEPSSRPGATFDEEGVCMPCRYAESLDGINWETRRKDLQKIADWGRARQSGGYDCLIGVSGGKDSTRQAFYVRDELGLKPLLVCCSYPPEQAADRGAENLSNLVEHGFDLHYVSPSPETWKKMMRLSFREFAQWTRPTELALFSSVVRCATSFKIPLIFLGENPALAFGSKSGSLDGDAKNIRAYDTLSGANIEPWLDWGIPKEKLYWYTFPSDHEIERAALRLVYLGFYIRDFNDIANGQFALDHGFMPRKGIEADPYETGSINAFECVDEDFVHVNQFLKFIKLGFGKVIQQVSVQIRHGEITREEGLKLARAFDGRCSDRLIENFCQYLEITTEEFWDVVDKNRNRDLWQLTNQGEWELRFKPE
ncbi:MAG: LPS biosynthesis protein [Rhodospirillaceae bacterium]|nr:LPS biosynthesis protein [Rhodospirillaceae bacterium]